MAPLLNANGMIFFWRAPIQLFGDTHYTRLLSFANFHKFARHQTKTLCRFLGHEIWNFYRCFGSLWEIMIIEATDERWPMAADGTEHEPCWIKFLHSPRSRVNASSNWNYHFLSTPNMCGVDSTRPSINLCLRNELWIHFFPCHTHTHTRACERLCQFRFECGFRFFGWLLFSFHGLLLKTDRHKFLSRARARAGNENAATNRDYTEWVYRLISHVSFIHTLRIHISFGGDINIQFIVDRFYDCAHGDYPTIPPMAKPMHIWHNDVGTIDDELKSWFS